jgi:Ala-tRNA(Pro) deacylase
MSIPKHICEFLDSHRVWYQSCQHNLSFTAQGTAHAQHISGKELAKVVMVMADDHLVMTVLPASHRIDLEQLGRLLNCDTVRLATEGQFEHIFPDCEVGAMPPLGNLYSLQVWIDEALRKNPNILFNAGTHEATIKMGFGDYERLVQPKEGCFSILRH